MPGRKPSTRTRTRIRPSRYDPVPRRSRSSSRERSRSSSRERSRSRSPSSSTSEVSEYESQYLYQDDKFRDSSSISNWRTNPLLSLFSLRRKTKTKTLGRFFRRLRSRPLRLLCRPLPLFVLFVLLLCWQLVFNDSYNLSSAPDFEWEGGVNGVGNETVFIAANIVDGELIEGAWGEAVVELVGLLEGVSAAGENKGDRDEINRKGAAVTSRKAQGKGRVWVSIYGGPKKQLKALEERLIDAGLSKERVWCVSEEDEPLDMGMIPRTELPTGESRVKRIAWLAEVRNKVLEPLYKPQSNNSSRPGLEPSLLSKPDKLLFLNDIHFTPSSALRLLFGTNLDSNGIARYKAACAVDFVQSWKFYDTFATRDVEGYSIGVPIYPWFVNEGEAVSRRDVLEGRGAVRVRSCWGGMVAFGGEWFWGREEGMGADVHPAAQNAPKASQYTRGGDKFELTTARGKAKGNHGLGVPSLPLKFRSEPEPFWDSSECCLIHADIMALPDLAPSPSSWSSNAQNNTAEDPWDTGIYMNPYVRTAYSASTLRHIWLAKRFERLFSPVQRVLNYWAGMPRWNYRRMEKEGEKVRDRLWISVHSNLTEGEAIRRAEDEWRKVERNEVLVNRETLGKVRGKEYWGHEGYYVDYERMAKRGGYCGVRQLLVMKEGEVKEGEGNWDNLLDRVPPVDI